MSDCEYLEDWEYIEEPNPVIIKVYTVMPCWHRLSGESGKIREEYLYANVIVEETEDFITIFESHTGKKIAMYPRTKYLWEEM